ncbi:Asp-tRNA(Asn)/Glu-tRNA(Gln) amidotransferase subunit GatA [Mangrovivirga sp. M17]|uniref:Glutamyl-tRNA(Gln) amidotransferase subunit A n=1 Tax=Mangrovivirga halotolerans TaxID=2993936 RepID=A0ABT3RMB8_9BACT|nr:Asp-tRNA(Asn)/Glu-tRNA(Gln) amidotransferase subunit GatA [Mangrovivirga halotolerans]MCX2742879.1 Asp-tRNA(Asn)/Glu-tRNA(Gln) amidotransferase subunit GatA [Mangrovivirga halotolerans]
MKGNANCEKVVKHYLSSINEQKHLNAFIEVFEEEAIERAKEIDLKIREGNAGKLAGVVVGIKDVLCYKDHSLTCGSGILKGFKSLYTATAVQKLIDEDAIIIGILNCDEFAMGSSNETSVYGPTLNAVDNERVPGGSSGGSAVAVQAGLCTVSLGTDTGGSVRQPAGFCEVWGLKPTYSRISRYGLASYASSFDCIGTFTNSAEDAALLLEIMSGEDEKDSTSSSSAPENYQLEESTTKTYKVAYLAEALNHEGLSPQVRDVFQETLSKIKEAGNQVEEIKFDLLPYLLPTYYILTTAEASSNLSRYDGVRYGHRSDQAENPEMLYKKSRTEGFGPEVQKRIMLGTFVLSADYFDAYYVKALKARKLIRNKTLEILKEYDFIITPTAPTEPFKLGEKNKDQMEMYLGDVFTVQASLCGLPSLNIPFSNKKSGLPVGVQITGKPFKEKDLLQAGNFFSKL